MATHPRSLTGAALDHATRVARLQVESERRDTVGKTATAIYALIDQLDEVPLRETFPAAAFDARWEA